VNISAEPGIIGKIPAYMIRILIEDYIIRVPAPIGTEGQIVGSDAPIPAVEPEAVGAAASKMPYMAGTKATGPMTMLPRLVKMIVGIIGTGIMAYPDFAIDVGSGRMAGFIAEVMSRLVVAGGSVKSTGAVIGRMGCGGAGCSVLGKCRHRSYKQRDQSCLHKVHDFLLSAVFQIRPSIVRPNWRRILKASAILLMQMKHGNGNEVARASIQAELA
jgi:hypothetical protein